MHQYTCPSCHVILRREQPVPAGKKIRCPKCETVFAPHEDKVTAKAAPAAAPAAVAAKPKPVDEDNDRNPYAVKFDEEAEDAMREEKERAAQGLIRDRFKKSKRGPAMREVVRPANFMLAAGVLISILAVVGFIAGMFPLVFQDSFDPPKPPGMKYSEWEEKLKHDGPRKWSDEEWNALVIQRSIIMGIAALYFVIGACICVGGFKMRTLESYTWAWIGTVLCLLFGSLLLVVGIWCVMVLSNQAVKDGFAEEAPPEV